VIEHGITAPDPKAWGVVEVFGDDANRSVGVALARWLAGQVSGEAAERTRAALQAGKVRAVCIEDRLVVDVPEVGRFSINRDSFSSRMTTDQVAILGRQPSRRKWFG
jgi:hypothetical protein